MGFSRTTSTPSGRFMGRTAVGSPFRWRYRMPAEPSDLNVVADPLIALTEFPH